MISAKVIAHSSHKGKEVCTMELEYPRYIHAELMTHRVFSRNAASSRAIPIEAMITQVEEHTVMPLWTQNQAGMQGKLITNGNTIHTLNDIWLEAAHCAVEHAKLLADAGAHKQNVNRILEPFQHIKVIVTSTQWINWDNLRTHSDAQPEIQALAKEMYFQRAVSHPKELQDGDWHTPYAEASYAQEDRLAISASCCAQVSYRKLDDDLTKAFKIYGKLIQNDPIHASPFEHQCTPLLEGDTQKGNLIGWHQYRTVIEALKRKS